MSENHVDNILLIKATVMSARSDFD